MSDTSRRPTSESGRLSRRMYDDLGACGLERHTDATSDALTVERLDALLNASQVQRVLDAGCGYGRIAIPLALRGYDVTGVDVTASMLAAAEQRQLVANAPKITWVEADICALPFNAPDFDAVLCMWLTFNELLQPSEQVAALVELHRVVRPGGWVLIDGPPFLESEDQPESLAPTVAADEGEVFMAVDPTQSSTGRRFVELSAAAGIRNYQLLVDDCPGRRRYFFRFWRDS